MGIQIGSFLIPYYGLFIVLGILFASIVGYIQVKKFHLDINDFIILAAMVVLGGFAGAKILYLLVSIKQIDWTRITDLSYLNALISGGFVFYGGLIGGLLILIPCKKIFHIKINEYVAACMPCIPIVHGFGRLGCSFVGCCYGAPYDGLCAIVYHDSQFAPNNISLFPVQLVEAILNFVIAGILLWYIYKRKNQQLHTLSLYLFLYAPIRFGLEFFRYDFAERGFIGVFSTSQWISVGLVLVGVLLIKYNKKRYH